MKRNEKGIALLMAMFCVIVMSFMAVEISFDTSVEYTLANKEFSKAKAYAAAKAGVDLSLLRIQLFKNVTTSFGEQLKGQEGLLQMIWSFPFAWPPSIPKNTSITDMDQVQSAVGESLMEAKYFAQISSEGSKIDLNDLDSPSEGLRKSTRQQLLNIFENKKTDEAWREKHRNFEPEELINNIQDWIDEDGISLNGGDEKSRYKDINEEQIPPNRPFQTMDEVRMISGMEDDIFELLLSQVTVYGIKGININQANKDILKSIDQIITDEVVSEIIGRRSNPDKGGPFKDEADFLGFIGANPTTFNPTQIPLYFGNEYNFRIRSIGESGNVTSEIIAIVYDVEAVRDQLKGILDKEEAQKIKDGGGTPPATPSSSEKKKPSMEKPRVIYWWES